MKPNRILCLGASNTWGYDPRSFLGSRYSPENRWPELLGTLLGCETVNLGVNGEELPHSAEDLRWTDKVIRRHLPADLLILSLGTNDLLRMYPVSPERVAERLKACLLHLREEFPGLTVLVLCPPTLGVPEEKLADASRRLALCYRNTARALGLPFAECGALPLSYDGVHLSEEGHHVLAEQLAEQLREGILCS